MKNHRSLTDGYTVEPLTMAAIPEVVDMLNSHSMATLGIKTEVLEDDIAYWLTPGLNLESDTRIIRDSHGKVVGFAEFWDLAEPHTRYNVFGTVHPDYEGLGIGSYLLAWLEDRAQLSLVKAPPEAQVILAHGIDSRLAGSARMLEANGFQLTWRYYHMHIELDQPIPEPNIPVGITIWTVQNEEDQRRLLLSLWDAFHDHWGYVEEPFEVYYDAGSTGPIH